MKKKSIVFVFVVALVLLSALTLTACKEDVVNVTEVTLDIETFGLVVGANRTMVATVLPEDATDKSVTWSTANADIATVDANGKVTAVAVGETTITVTTTDGGKTASATVIVSAAPVAVTEFKFNKAAMELVPGGKFQLKPVFTPAGATNTNYSDITSSNTAVVTVGANGWITAVAAGTAEVTATSEDGGFEAKCTFTVVARSEGVLVVGYSPFSSKFSPFFSKTAYDQDVAAMTQVSLLTTDRQGNIIFNAIEGETVKYNGVDYDYSGIANIAVNFDQVANETVYTIEMKDDLKFSDGTPVTIDDVIFSMYVLADPFYTGSSTLYSTKIKGMNAYRTNNLDMTTEAKAFMEEVTAIVEEGIEADDYFEFYEALEEADKEIVDWVLENMQLTEAWGWVFDYPLATLQGYYGGETAEETYFNIGMDEIFAGYYEDYADQLEARKALQLVAEYIAENPEAEVKSIEGIEKTGTYSLKVTTEGFEATTIYQLGVSVAPLHYYGDVAKFDIANNKFGFDKGDLSTVEAKTTQPMGAGPYKFIKFENGIVYFEANSGYYKGAPKIANVQFRETTDADKIAGIIAGTFDVTDPSISAAAVDQIKDANGNNQLSGSFIDTSLVDNLGYGYIGINADRVKVGGDAASEASKNLRKAYATIFAVYREVVVNSYYGDRASVIEYPISNTSWAAPQPADEGYAAAYSKKVNGDPIFTANMTAEQKYAAAIDAVKGFLTAAGFTPDANGKFTNVPTLTAHIPADGTGDHPSFGILTYAKEALATIGVNLVIQDYANSANFWDTLEGNGADIWCAAWGATIDPDMYQVYYSTNAIIVGTGTNSNHYNIQDDELDQLIIDARQSDDQAYRKATYKQALEVIMDWGVEIPTYQRKNAIIFSAGRVDLATVTPDITPFWGWMSEIEKLEMK